MEVSYHSYVKIDPKSKAIPRSIWSLDESSYIPGGLGEIVRVGRSRDIATIFIFSERLFPDFKAPVIQYYFAAMKQQLLLTLFSSLVLSSSGTPPRYSVFFPVAGDRVLEDCDVEIGPTTHNLYIPGMTPNNFVMDALDSCVVLVTGEHVKFSIDIPNPLDDRESDSTMTGERLLLLKEDCSPKCCNTEACMLLGYCASMGETCGSMPYERRRLTVTSGNRGLNPLDDLSKLSECCTEKVKALVTLFGLALGDNQCFGDHDTESIDKIECTVSVME
jgi:hypothetical protein